MQGVGYAGQNMYGSGWGGIEDDTPGLYDDGILCAEQAEEPEYDEDAECFESDSREMLGGVGKEGEVAEQVNEEAPRVPPKVAGIWARVARKVCVVLRGG
jgi:hypothetical protein